MVMDVAALPVMKAASGPLRNFDRVPQQRKHVMPDTHALAERSNQSQVAVYDAIVIGAGISGMYMLYRLRELGMRSEERL